MDLSKWPAMLVVVWSEASDSASFMIGHVSEIVEPNAGDARGGSLPGGYGGSKTATVLEELCRRLHDLRAGLSPERAIFSTGALLAPRFS